MQTILTRIWKDTFQLSEEQLLLRAHYLVGTVLSALHVFTHLIHKITWWDRYYYCPHFTEEETKPQSWINRWGSQAVEAGANSGSRVCEPMCLVSMLFYYITSFRSLWETISDFRSDYLSGKVENRVLACWNNLMALVSVSICSVLRPEFIYYLKCVIQL